MYENLLYQDDISNRLQHDLREGSAPPAMLFSGPALTGKLTAALETARILSCRNTGNWNCTCSMCAQHRSLAHPHTILAGSRNFAPDIAASVDLLRRDSTDIPRFILVRSVRKLLRHFDPILWDGEDRKISRVYPVLEQLSEIMDSLISGVELLSGNRIEKILQSIVDNSTAVQKFLPGALPVSHVRNITHWATLSAGNDHKTVIIDSADQMMPSARNALLKFLEEPPASTTVILIAKRKALLLPTIVSRVRDYAFHTRTPEEETQIIKRVFRENGGDYTGLADFFQNKQTGQSGEADRLARSFLEGLGKKNFPAELNQVRDCIQLRSLLEAVSKSMESHWKVDEASSPLIQYKKMKYLNEAEFQAVNLNLPTGLVLNHLYLSLRDLR